ncbi:MAG: response regulator [Limisphaerales bacterium]
MLNAIVIVDDDSDEAALIKRAVLSLRPKSPIRTVLGGKELLQYLEGEGCYADREEFPPPGVILLDLRMPEMNGFELLEWIKNEPRHSGIPVIVISSFDRQREIRKSYQLGARTFLSKPVNPESIRDAIRALRLPIEFFD